MNQDRFSNRDHFFEFGGIKFQFDWKTSSSISFWLCSTKQESRATHVFGWLDVHDTQDEDRRVKIRVCTNHNYLKFSDCSGLIDKICNELSLPNDSYDASFVSPLKQFSYQSECVGEIVSYGESDPDDIGWDDRDGISPPPVSGGSSGGGPLSPYAKFWKDLNIGGRLHF